MHLSEPTEFSRYLRDLKHIKWVVYAKEPLGGPQQVLDYLGRYTHRVAISNNRLCSLTYGHVTFRWKDYRHPGRLRLMRLDVHEFIRRFLLHVLPRGLQRIRHCGLLSNRLRESRLNTCRQLLGVAPAEVTSCTPKPDYRRWVRATHRSLTTRMPGMQTWTHALHRSFVTWRAAAGTTDESRMNRQSHAKPTGYGRKCRRRRIHSLRLRLRSSHSRFDLISSAFRARSLHNPARSTPVFKAEDEVVANLASKLIDSTPIATTLSGAA
jgi:hypothetical protein